ncbi:MAG: DUF1259 domain-containing protein [Nitrososphaeraceae archaeon]
MTRTITTSSKMRSKYTPQLLIGVLVISMTFVSAAILLTTMADDSFAQGNNNNATSPNSTSSNTNPSNTASTIGNKLNCQSIAIEIAGVSVPNPSKICDVLILRQSPTIIGPGNMNMNKFSVINSIVEVASMSELMNKSGGSAGSSLSSSASPGAANNTTGQKVFVMGEFGLLEPQLVPMVKAAVGSNWTILAVHNHMVQEKPKMIFVHWSAQGDLNTITNQIKNVLLRVSKVPNAGSSSSSH